MDNSIKYRIQLSEPVARMVLIVLRKYNMPGYKFITFSIIPELRHGRFNNEQLKDNQIYTLTVPFDRLFTKLYGTQTVMFQTQGDTIYMLLDSKTEYVFRKLYSRLCPTYKGVPIIDDNASFRSKILL